MRRLPLKCTQPIQCRLDLIRPQAQAQGTVQLLVPCAWSNGAHARAIASWHAPRADWPTTGMRAMRPSRLQTAKRKRDRDNVARFKGSGKNFSRTTVKATVRGNDSESSRTPKERTVALSALECAAVVPGAHTHGGGGWGARTARSSLEPGGPPKLRYIRLKYLLISYVNAP